MLTVQYTPTTMTRQAPQEWSIYNALTTDEMRALHDAGVRIRGRYVMARTCPECGQPGEVGVTETTLQDGIAFIVRDGWTCRACRERETAHWVASPKPTPASRGGSVAGGSRSEQRRHKTSHTHETRAQAATRKAWWLYHDALDTLEAIERGEIPDDVADSAERQMRAAWRVLVRYHAVGAEIVRGVLLQRGQEVQS